MVTLKNWNVGYGKIGLNGQLGYFGFKVEVPGTEGFVPISAHAPSEGEIVCDRPTEIFAAQNVGPDSRLYYECFVDGNPLGLLKAGGERTRSIVVAPGRHRLQFCVERNRNSRSVWFYREAQEKELPVEQEEESEEENDEVDTCNERIL